MVVQVFDPSVLVRQALVDVNVKFEQVLATAVMEPLFKVTILSHEEQFVTDNVLVGVMQAASVPSPLHT